MSNQEINIAIIVDNQPSKKYIKLMRRSNCSFPIPQGSPGVRGKMCVIKRGGSLENKVKKGGAVKNEWI